MAEVLVTGGNGYLGSYLVRRLLERGHRVRVLDINDAVDRPPAVEMVQADIRDYGAVERACAGIDAVYHNVAQVPLAKDARLLWTVNRDGTDNLLRAALACRVRKVVYTSSSAVFGVPARNPVDDTVEPAPLEEYGRAKLEGERLCVAYAERGVDTTIVRPRTILGSGRLGIFQMLFDWIADGRNVYVLGRGDNVYQFVHAEDLAEALMRAAERPGFAVYNIGAARYGTMRESIEGLVAHAATGSRVRSLPVAPAVLGMKALSTLGWLPFAPYHWLMYSRSMYFDLTRPMRELSWQPKWGNVEMLVDSYDWYLAHRDEARAAGPSAHRSPVKQGLLRLLRWMS